MDGLAFTEMAWEHLYDAVDNPYFEDLDSELIYEALENQLQLIPFGDYLKRYIYRKYKMTDPFEQVPLQEYQAIIRESFHKNRTPASFTPGTAKLNALSKNWLTQTSVNRQVVFLLGFGLSMTEEDVMHFLTYVLREQGINMKDPFEVICWYCFAHGYGFDKYQELNEKYARLTEKETSEDKLFSQETVYVRHMVREAEDEEQLMEILAQLKKENASYKLSVTARKFFLSLFEEAKTIIADIYNRDEKEKLDNKTSEYKRKLEVNDHLTQEEKNRRIQKMNQTGKAFAPEDITERDIEQIICSAIPLDRHGNLTKAKAGSLNEQFTGKRFSRQHIRQVLDGKTEVNRFDLITLKFFVFSQHPDEYSNTRKRYRHFIDSTNEILEQCSMAPLYVANPYECFILMCILSDDPLGTYADVWELSYNKETRDK